MANVEIYTTKVCPYCVRAKDLLTRKKIPFTEIDVSDDEVQRQVMEKLSGRRTVPQVFINGQAIGGCDDLYALEAAGKLQEMVHN
ncbi:MAG: glutaredoxin 3 [Gammaproteobacteria bacterium]